MFLLNLSLAQFLALFASVSALMVALYLLDRSRRRQKVATLRFWVAAEQPAIVKRRKRIQQPLSLLLQILSVGLLLLAIAQLRIGAKSSVPRDHVLILDASAWMGARSERSERGERRTLMDDARERALRYIRSVPANDRVMLVRADGLTTPATPFEPNREVLEQAIQRTRPGATALNLEQAFAFASRVLSQAGRRAGEVVYCGPGRVSGSEAQPQETPRNLRILPVADRVENSGFRKIGLRRSASDPDVWEIYISVRNYGAAAHTVRVALAFGQSPAGSRTVNIPPGGEREVVLQHRTRAAGLLEARLLPGDAFPDDDRAVLELPAQRTVNVTVYSEEPDLLRPVLSANPRVNAQYRRASEYRPNDAGLVILDRMRVFRRPAGDSIWIDPPGDGSPVPIRSRVEKPQFARWASEHALGVGLATRDLRLDSVSVFEAAPTDIRVADVEGGPVIVARPGKPKTVVLGFHPSLTSMRYELATPLLFANMLEWIAPEVFRRSEFHASSAGTVNVALAAEADPASARVLRDDGTPLPFTVHGRSVQFFAGTPCNARVLAGDREFVYALTLPQLWDVRWQPPANAKNGIPRVTAGISHYTELWQALALLGGLGLLAEWILFGRIKRGLERIQTPPRAMRKAS
jgi:hypothetical protein